MAATIDRTPRIMTRPFPAFLLAGTVPLFLGALLADFAYWSTYQIQWSDFASWLIVGALLFAGGALVFAIVELVGAGRRERRSVAYSLTLAAAWLLGLLNALVHARDAWAVMPAGLLLSGLILVLAGAASWIGFSRLPVERAA